MPQKNTYIGKLILKYGWRQELSKKELSDLQAWQARSPHHQEMPDQFRNIEWVKEELQKIAQFPKDKIWQRLKEEVEAEQHSSPVPLWQSFRIWRYAIAAVLFIAFAWTGWRYMHHPPAVAPIEIATNSRRSGTRIPENFQVLLTLDDSSHIILNGMSNNIQLPPQSGSTLTRTGANNLSYTTASAKSINDATGSEYHTSTAAVSIYNSITTRQADPFHLTLPDGSKVTLCYASDLKYPVGFNGATREVTLSGQALFEIAPIAKKPFIVYANGVKTEVLGTSFNIMAYPGEHFSKISVFDGSVKVTRDAETVTLMPFEQVVLTDKNLKTGKIKDSTDIMSWNTTDSSFHFKNADLLAVTRELARWYKVEIYNPDSIKGVTISASFQHSLSLKDILQVIQQVQSGDAFLTLRNDTILVSATKQNR